ncbi:hypothetical protein HYG86_11200 [Alkalicella caledoniensis]|uniref:Uncharacterized protein n=1 Tax=Alkalicella caledoniensis TaxID=2731377 RepID=A0A7G9W9C6_ALKCA|nr:hypothetical protein [Alkalicella caledoniensis]QNO15288.1 hypothetical protein HYG86_11200 [Alkalicella caledoniensis]
MSEKKTFEVGGMKITKLVSQNQIDQFVQTLPEEEKQDVKNVILALNEEGLIKIEEA